MRNLTKNIHWGASVLVLAIVPSVAHAQATPEAVPEAAAETEVIVVTGSQIRRSAEESSVPLQILGAENIEESGTTDLAEAVVDLPGVSDGISPQGSNDSIQASGLSTISLRRLGDNRTLTLINSRRAVSNSGNSDRVSLDTIPAGFVKRVEITTGGASAIYGSDAIAGVANIILEDDLDGLRLDARYSVPERSGGEELRLEGTFGTRFAGDRGYVMIGASYRNENKIVADSSRSASVRPVEFDNPTTSANDSFANEVCDPTNTSKECLLPDYSGTTPGGVFESGDAWFKDGQWYNDMSLQPSNRTGSQDFYADYDGYNVRPGRSLRPDREMLSVALHSTFDFTDTSQFTVTGMYSRVDTDYIGDYESLSNSDSFGLLDSLTVGDMASNHPFIVPAVAETRSGTVSFDRRLVELGRNQRINKRETYRFMTDLSGQFSDRLHWTVYGTYGHFSQDQKNPNEVNFLRAKEALAIESDGAGGYRCRSATARANGCVPLNLFGEGSISDAAADYIRYNGYGSQTRDQYSAGAVLRSDTFSVFGLDTRFAAGIEFRREEQDTYGDPDGDPVGGVDGDPTTADYAVTSLATFPSLSAGYSTWEGFIEVDTDVIADVLNVQGAFRVADYSTIGTIFSYNAGAVLSVSDDLRFRAQYSRSQRAPNLTEFFSPPRPDSDDLSDPCEGMLADGSGLTAPRSVGGENVDLAVVRANCLATPGIAAFFANPDNTGRAFDPSDSIQGPNAGNSNLKEETADTITAGFVYTPSWANRLSLIGDYYRISIKDAISSISTQNVVDMCYADADFPNNRFCDIITRNPVNGQVVEVVNRVENLNRELVEGIDVGLNWRQIELGGIPGQFDLDTRWSHYFKQQVSFLDLAGDVVTNTSLGSIGVPKDELRAQVGYRIDNFRFTYTMTYESGGIDDLVNGRNPSDDVYFRVKGQDYHRIYARYDFGADDRFSIYGGINNLFNSLGPLVPSGTLAGSSRNIVTSLNDAVGREFYLGARARF